ncbi:hypothetical protein ACTFIR_004049 [Dictyostelium discoideum]
MAEQDLFSLALERKHLYLKTHYNNINNLDGMNILQKSLLYRTYLPFYQTQKEQAQQLDQFQKEKQTVYNDNNNNYKNYNNNNNNNESVNNIIINSEPVYTNGGNEIEDEKEYANIHSDKIKIDYVDLIGKPYILDKDGFLPPPLSKQEITFWVSQKLTETDFSIIDYYFNDIRKSDYEKKKQIKKFERKQRQKEKEELKLKEKEELKLKEKEKRKKEREEREKQEREKQEQEKQEREQQEREQQEREKQEREEQQQQQQQPPKKKLKETNKINSTTTTTINNKDNNHNHYYYYYYDNNDNDNDGDDEKEKENENENEDENMVNSEEWTEEEVNKMNEIRGKLSTADYNYWDKVSAHVKSKTAEQCQRKYNSRFLTPLKPKSKLKSSSKSTIPTSPITMKTNPHTDKGKRKIRQITDESIMKQKLDLFDSLKTSKRVDFLQPLNQVVTTTNDVESLDFGENLDEAFSAVNGKVLSQEERKRVDREHWDSYIRNSMGRFSTKPPLKTTTTTTTTTTSDSTLAFIKNTNNNSNNNDDILKKQFSIFDESSQKKSAEIISKISSQCEERKKKEDQDVDENGEDDYYFGGDNSRNGDDDDDDDDDDEII